MPWTDESSTTNSVGVNLEVGGGFGPFAFSIRTNYRHRWTKTFSVSGSKFVTVPPHGVGFIDVATRRHRVHGTWELHFEDRYYDHYVWTFPFRASGPIGRKGVLLVTSHKMKPKLYNAVCH